MRFAYHLEPDYRDEHGHWHPRLIWADGMVTLSQGRINAESWQQARRELGQWNWRYGMSANDAALIINEARSHNATLTYDPEAWR